MVHKRKDEIATSKSEWGTPWPLYNYLDSIYHFDADAAASVQNAKHKVFFTKSMNALTLDWKEAIEWKKPEVEYDPFSPSVKKDPAFFLNPVYSKGVIDKFMAKARYEGGHGSTVVCLLPVASDTGWWNKYVMADDGHTAVEVQFIEGRVYYVGYTKSGIQIKQSPTFPSCVVIFCGEHPHYWNQDRSGPYLPILGPVIHQRDSLANAV